MTHRSLELVTPYSIFSVSAESEGVCWIKEQKGIIFLMAGSKSYRFSMGNEGWNSKFCVWGSKDINNR